MAKKKGEQAALPAMVQFLGGEEKTVAIESVTPHPENARAGNVAAIKRSIMANGFYGRLVVWKTTNQIIAGSHRWTALGELGATEVPVVVVDVSERVALRIVAADNRSSDLAGYHDVKLAALLKHLMANDDLEAVNYGPEDVNALLKKLEPKVAPGEFKNLDPGGMHLARQCPSCGFEFIRNAIVQPILDGIACEEWWERRSVAGLVV